MSIEFIAYNKTWEINGLPVDPSSTNGIWNLSIKDSAYRGIQNLNAFRPTDPDELYSINVSNHPKLMWTGSEPADVAKYRIYRDNTLIDSTNAGVTEYTDNAIRLNGGTNQPFVYKIRAVSGDWSKYSQNYSNQETVYGIEYFEKKSSETASLKMVPVKNEIIGIYPNPFNPQTKISYSVKDQSTVRISVLDMVGREVAVLVNEEKGTGDYEITFNGLHLSSGAYICALRVGSQTDFRKMILMK